MEGHARILENYRIRILLGIVRTLVPDFGITVLHLSLKNTFQGLDFAVQTPQHFAHLLHLRLQCELLPGQGHWSKALESVQASVKIRQFTRCRIEDKATMMRV